MPFNGLRRYIRYPCGLRVQNKLTVRVVFKVREHVGFCVGHVFTHKMLKLLARGYLNSTESYYGTTRAKFQLKLLNFRSAVLRRSWRRVSNF